MGHSWQVRERKLCVEREESLGAGGVSAFCATPSGQSGNHESEQSEGGLGLARFPPFPLVLSLSSGAPIALKDKKVKWLLSLSPQLLALDTTGPSGEPGELEGGSALVTLSMPRPSSSQTPGEG